MYWKKYFSKRTVALLVTLLGLLIGAAGATVAFIVTSSTEVVNTFQVPEMEPSVDETFEENDKEVKENVAIDVEGDVPVYVRAKIVVTWMNADGKVYAKAPVKGEDYQMTAPNISASGDWMPGSDGFYYYKDPVEPGRSTSNLIDRCVQLQEGPETGYTLSVEIIAEIIQSTPVDAVQESWGVTVNQDKTISVSSIVSE